MYGTDVADNPPDPSKPVENPPVNLDNLTTEVDHAWRSDSRYLATPDSQRIEDIKADVKRLGLPRAVIDKIYYKNAHRIYLRGR